MSIFVYPLLLNRLHEMHKELDSFYLDKDEPVKTTLLVLREIILKQDQEITNVRKYGMPFFCYKGKMFCYLWIQKTSGMPYIGFVEGKHFDDNELLTEKRSRMKIFLIDPNEDLPIAKINALLAKAVALYKMGIISIK